MRWLPRRDGGSRAGRRRAKNLGVLSGLATAAATWGILGDVSEPDGWIQMVPAPRVPRGVELAIGAAGALALVAIAVALRRTAVPRATGELVTLFVLFGCITAAAWRVLSSHTYGANIGGGLILMSAPFIVAGFAIAIARVWRRLGDGA